MKKTPLFILFLLFSLSAFSKNTNAQREFYIVQIFHCSNQNQIEKIDKYLSEQYLPFLHANGIVKVGVFAPIDNDTAVDKRLIVWIPIKSLDKLNALDEKIEAIDPMSNTPLIQLENEDGSLPYVRIEKMIAKSFKQQPFYEKQSTLTKSADRIYEFRSYESETEHLHLKKVHMFNEGGEIELFKRLHFNAVFYAKVIAGAKMPNLIYMTSFNSMEDRSAHWKAFSDDPQWKNLSAMDIYKKTVSKNDTVLMTARVYADF